MIYDFLQQVYFEFETIICTIKRWNSLMVASLLGYKNIVKILLDLGADINAKDNNGQTALMRATDHGYTEIITLLLDKGADINANNNDGKSALKVAIENSRTETVILLIRNGAEIPQDKTALINTLKKTNWWSKGHLNIIKNTPRNNNHEQDVSKLELAILFQNRQYVQGLINNGINYDNDKCLEIARKAQKLDLIDLFQREKPEIKKEVIIIEDDNEPLHSSSISQSLKRKCSQITGSSSNEKQHKNIESENEFFIVTYH